MVFTPALAETFLIEKPMGFSGEMKILYMRGIGAAPFSNSAVGRVEFEIEDTQTAWLVQLKIKDALAGVVNELQ